jgi:BNR repeat-like domain
MGLEDRVRRTLRLTAAALALSLALFIPAAHAATPPAATIAPPSGSVTWQGQFFPAAANVDNVQAPPKCPGDPGAVPGFHQCDTFELTVNSGGYWSSHKGGVNIRIEWSDPNNDFDMYVYRKPAPGAPLGNPVGSSAEGGTTEEHVVLYAPEGTYLVRVVPYTVAGSDYKGSASFFDLAPIPSVPGGVDQFRASHDQYNSHSEPHVAVDPLDPEHLVAGSKQYQNLEGYKFKIGTYASFDGGHAWRDNGHLPGYPAQTGNEGSGYWLVSDIWHAFDDEGNAYAMVLDNPPGSATDAGWGMTLHKSTDGGRTWGPRIPIEEKSDPIQKNAFLADKNAITVDNYGPDRDGKTGNMYSCWSEDVPVANVAVAVKRSTDGGRTWTDKNFVSVADRTILGCFPVVAPPTQPGQPGPVFVFWMDFGSTNPDQSPRIRMAKSTDGGQSWSPPTTVSTIERVDAFPNSAFRVDSLPTAGIDPADGTLYVAWANQHKTQEDADCEDPPAGQVCDADIVMSKSTDGGDTWSTPKRVNQDTAGNGKDQFQPQLAVTTGGQLDMMWFDRRHDPQDFYIDTYMARSNDKGGSWHETRVTKKMWDPSINPPISPSGQFIGDYQGMAATDCAANPFWNDTTAASLPTSDPEYSPWQEVFAADIPNTTTYGGRAAPGSLPARCSLRALARTPLLIGGRFVISRRAVKMRRSGVIPVRVSCRTPLGCRGRLHLRTYKRVRSHGRTRLVKVNLGSKRFNIRSRVRNKVLRVRAPRKARAYVQRKRRVHVAASANVRIGNDIKGRVGRKFRLHRARVSR